MLKIRRALISVWDKKNVVELAKSLAKYGVEIISTGKTAAMIAKSGVPVKEVAQVTGFPEVLSGRLKTLHPVIFGGILANKKHPLHMEEIKNLNIQPIDMVVTNFYPFQDKLKENLSLDEMIEYIDVGGPAMLRAGAKNFKNVACVSEPGQYKEVMAELERSKGFICEELLKTLAARAFLSTKQYDGAVFAYFSGQEVESLDLVMAQKLRYGENPHQQASLYRRSGQESLVYRQLQGKEISFNNLLDLDAALGALREFSEPAAVIVKHSSICGVGTDKVLSKAFRKAHLVDPVSSFGGIVSLNRRLDSATAAEILKSDFKECIIAPGFGKETLKMFAAKKNLRLLEVDLGRKCGGQDLRSTAFGYLLQDRDTVLWDKAKLRVVTRKKPTRAQTKDLLFAWKTAKHVRSNAITVVKNSTLLGLGGGQPSRVGSCRIALEQAGPAAAGASMASDGFFPKDDSIVLAKKKGIKAIIQPGGSIRDEEIIKRCDKLGLAMVFTGIRHFKH